MYMSYKAKVVVVGPETTLFDTVTVRQTHYRGLHKTADSSLREFTLNNWWAEWFIYSAMGSVGEKIKINKRKRVSKRGNVGFWRNLKRSRWGWEIRKTQPSDGRMLLQMASTGYKSTFGRRTVHVCFGHVCPSPPLSSSSSSCQKRWRAWLWQGEREPVSTHYIKTSALSEPHEHESPIIALLHVHLQRCHLLSCHGDDDDRITLENSGLL